MWAEGSDEGVGSIATAKGLIRLLDIGRRMRCAMARSEEEL